MNDYANVEEIVRRYNRARCLTYNGIEMGPYVSDNTKRLLGEFRQRIANATAESYVEKYERADKEGHEDSESVSTSLTETDPEWLAKSKDEKNARKERGGDVVTTIAIGLLAALVGLLLYRPSQAAHTGWTTGPVELLLSGVRHSVCAAESRVFLDPPPRDCDAALADAYRSLVSLVRHRCASHWCDKRDTVSAGEAYELVSAGGQLRSRRAEAAVELFEFVARAYPDDSPLLFADGRFAINEPDLCSLRSAVRRALWLTAIAASVVAIAFVARGVAERRRDRELRVRWLVDRVVLELRRRARRGHDYVAITYLRDLLIPDGDRRAASDLWSRVERRVTLDEPWVRTGTRQIDGEDFAVWRWASPDECCGDDACADDPAERGWHGRPSPVTNCRPTHAACMEVRNMFIREKALCETRVVNAVLEKCDGLSIVHVSVDREGPYGSVFVRCASAADGGTAYDRLHGFRFDGQMVAVQFVLTDVYDRRFPDSAAADSPL